MAGNDLAAAILASSKRLGIDPVDLATAVSYETAGTFDPWKAGPTTQWGQHRGLIQWGEPQRKKYGVSQGMPVAAQMQAAERYLKDAGVRPGMGLLDVYSAINAGSVGRYGASDANNGGAPGNVRDKVQNQMGGHRKKAEALLGGKFTPAAAGAPATASRMLSPQPMAQTPEATMAPALFGDLVAANQVQTVPVPQPQDFATYLAQRKAAEAEAQAADQQRKVALFGDDLFGIYS